MTDDVQATVYASAGRWVAMCPRPYCYNAEHQGEHVPGHPGGLWGDSFRCSACGLLCRAAWPPNRTEIAALLMQRPVPLTRNWVPGETLADLLVENLQHGISPLNVEALEASPDGKVFQLNGDILELGPAAVAGDVARLALGRG